MALSCKMKREDITRYIARAIAYTDIEQLGADAISAIRVDTYAIAGKSNAIKGDRYAARAKGMG